MLQPHCCAPGCGAFPDCGFVERIILDDGKLECNIDGERAFYLWLQGGLFMQVDPLEPLLGFARLASRPLPSAWQEFFASVGALPDMHAFRFVNARDLALVRLVKHEHAGPVGWAADEKGRRAVTFDDVISVRPGVFDYVFENDPPTIEDLTCRWQSLDDEKASMILLLAHELLHVKQYFEMGPSSFYAHYLPDQGTFEDEANEMELVLEQSLEDSDGTCEDSTIPVDLYPQGGHALSARDWLHVNDRASVTTSNYDRCHGPLSVALRCWSTLSSGGYLGVGADAKTGDLWARGGIQLRSRAYVDGDVTTAASVDFQHGAEVRGDVTEGALVELANLWNYSPDLPWPASSFILFRSGNLAPGNYGTLIAEGESITLTSGDYYFNSLQIEPRVRVVVNTDEGPVRVFIRESFMHKGRFEGAADSIFIAYLGEEDIHIEGRLKGTLVAPRAFVNLQSGNIVNSEVSHEGAVFAEAIELHQGAVFAQVPYRHDW